MKIIQYILTLIILGFIAWSAGFAYFISTAKTFTKDHSTTTDAIVVLTGEKTRVERGIHLLQEGYAPIIFITGTNPRDQLQELMIKHKIDRNQMIYDTKADEHIHEISGFIGLYSIRSVRIITSKYNMPVALIKIKQGTPPSLAIISDPVDDNMGYLAIASEYNKYLSLIFAPYFQ